MENPKLEKGSKQRNDIERLQLALCDYGLEVNVDAHFGPDVEQKVKTFQETLSLEIDGIVGAQTWSRLAMFSKYGTPPELELETHLPGFSGDLHWIHRHEGHHGRPYWPGGCSGVTLDPGLDLGHSSAELVSKLCREILPEDQWKAVEGVIGKRGETAKEALEGDPRLMEIRILRCTAIQLLPRIARSYWEGTRTRFLGLDAPETPPEVHTAMLSLTYNRGAKNEQLGSLEEPIKKKDWPKVGALIGRMQQDHELQGVRQRRKEEGKLILDALGSGKS